jgi:Ca-activated chloride channel family protein
VVVRYVSVGDEIAHHELTVPVVANVVSAEEAARAEPDAEVREEVLVLAAARARDEAIRLADAGDYDAARAGLAATMKQLRAVGGLVLAAEATALADALPLLERFDAVDRKRLFYESNERKRRRDA